MASLPRRLLALAVTLWLISLVVFLVVHVVPGDPATLILGNDASPDELAHLRTALGLDRPLPAQYLSWLGQVARGDLGKSLRYDEPVARLIGERLPVTLSLATFALLLALALAVPLGVLSATHPRSPFDYATLVLSQVGLAFPAFWVGIMLILLFAVARPLFPTGGFVPWTASPLGALRSLTLPAVALGLPMTAVLMRLVRAAVLDEMAQDHVWTARAKGLPEWRVVLRHALRNALIPTVTMLGLQLSFLLGGSIVVEQVFSLPGLGRLVVFAIFNRDIPLIQGLVMFLAGLVVLINFAVDILYALLDPRISLS